MKEWSGPYAPKDRHADNVTIDHIIDLRKRVALLEKQLENVLSWVNSMRGDLANYSAALHFIATAKPLGGQSWEGHAKEMADYAIKELERRKLPND